MTDGDIVLAVQSEREWQIFCADVLKDATFATDPRFDLNVRRIANRESLDSHIQSILERHTQAEVAAALDKACIAYGTVSTIGGLLRHVSGTTLPVETPAGVVELLAPPAIVDGKRPVIRRVPRFGEHDHSLWVEFTEAAA